MTTPDSLAQSEYKYGFVTDIEEETAPRGLTEATLRWISAKKNEPEFMLEGRLRAFKHFMTLVENHQEPKWANVHYPPIDFANGVYYAAPKTTPASLEDVDAEILSTYEKLGIPLEEQKRLAGVAVDAVFDSVSVATTFKETLGKQGIIFGSFADAVQEHPDLIKKYLGSVVPYTDNFYAALNAAVFSDGSFCYIPKGVRCPLELSTYFRINAAGTVARDAAGTVDGRDKALVNEDIELLVTPVGRVDDPPPRYQRLSVRAGHQLPPTTPRTGSTCGSGISLPLMPSAPGMMSW